MPGRVEGKIAIITGGMRGIGKVTALKLASEGAIMVVTDLDEEACWRVVDEIRQMNGEAFAMRLDVTNYDEWRHVVNTVKEKYGRIDILVNNAGIIDLEEPGDLSKMDAILNVNLKGVIMGCNAVLPVMMEQRYGKIINISDTAAMVSWPKIPTYSAAKGGVIGLTRCYAGYLGQYNININAVVPGPIETQMLDDMLAKLGMSKEELSRTIPKGRIGSPWDVANAVTFLASDEADYVTGQVLVVDGGYTVR